MRAANKKLVSNVAFSAIIASLCVILMILCRVISITDYAVSAICGLLIGVVVIESGKRWALASYIVVSVLGLIFGGNECAVTFIIFLGYYPIIKVWLDSINKVLSYVIKFVLFNGMIIGAYFLLDALKFIPLDEIEWLGQYTYLVILILANVAFLIYDYAFNGVMALYFSKIHSKVSKIIKK